MAYEPPNGIASFTRSVQRASLEDAIELLRATFEAAGAEAVLRYIQVSHAAPALLAACELASCAALKGELIDWSEITKAIAQARGEQPHATV